MRYLKLNLGCGRQRRQGCLNVDIHPGLAPDLVFNLDRYPYPLRRNHFREIYVFDVLEHLERVEWFMDEMHALLARDGVLEITTPHFSSPNSYTDPTHRHHFGYFSFDYFTADSPYSFYSRARFEVVDRLIVFHASRLDRLIARFANHWPALYEKRCAWIWPAWFLILRLRALK